ncbi:hypothetical protein DIPPA_11115 [Diplonema papillatum]|nr:hypothetical protein DIPPA_11115 [Diplonema papillatum]
MTNLSSAEKAKYAAEAKKNSAARQKVRASFKKAPSKYALYVKQNFAAAYAAATRKTNDKKQAFNMATKEVAMKYKSSQ